MSKLINFVKMHGLGNDFIVVNAIQEPILLQPHLIASLANRHTGIGFDQLLVIKNSQNKDAEFECQIFNADGREAEQCGNGMRCVARYLHENKISPKNEIKIETKGGIVNASVTDYDNIKVTMGKPLLSSTHTLSINDQPYKAQLLSVGNPHVIVRLHSLDLLDIETIGKEISTSPLFKDGANVGFMEVLNRNTIKLSTYERGVGLTYACGSNACAAVAVGIKENVLANEVVVELELGQLRIHWDPKTENIYQTGPASFVYAGNCYI